MMSFHKKLKYAEGKLRQFYRLKNIELHNLMHCDVPPIPRLHTHASVYVKPYHTIRLPNPLRKKQGQVSFNQSPGIKICSMLIHHTNYSKINIEVTPTLNTINWL
jgi:hypothetical protein